MIQVRELKGYRSYEAFNAFQRLVIGLKMLPEFTLEPYDSFLERVHNLDERQQENLIRRGALVILLTKEEIEALLHFAEDKNGVPYGPENIKNLTPDEIFEIVVAVCMALSKIKITFVKESEKKN